MNRRIRLGYADFWPEFNPENDYFTRLLRRRYDVELNERPDFLIYSVFGWAHLRHPGVRIFYTGENVRPDFRDCDYAFTFDHLDRPEHFRLPFYARRMEGADVMRRALDLERVLSGKTRFCTFVYSDPTGVRRNRFMRKLSRYKRVDSGGRYLNNIGAPVRDKQAFLAEGKFNIAFEHTSYPGYTTEKITDALRACTVPIYWGNRLIERDFAPGCYVNAHAFERDEDLIERIVELDRDDARYAECLRKPWFGGSPVNAYIDPEHILDQFDRIFETPIKPVAERRRRLLWWDRGLRPLWRRATRRALRRPRQWLKWVKE